MSMLDFIRIARAAKDGFSIKDGFEFLEFEDITSEDISQDRSFPDILEIMARIKVSYTGELPESYRTLNIMISDWVEENITPLTEEIHKRLIEYFKNNYPESDSSELEQLEDTAIWTDQLDYMPDIDEDGKSMVLDIELVLHGEPIND